MLNDVSSVLPRTWLKRSYMKLIVQLSPEKLMFFCLFYLFRPHPLYKYSYLIIYIFIFFLCLKYSVLNYCSNKSLSKTFRPLAFFSFFFYYLHGRYFSLHKFKMTFLFCLRFFYESKYWNTYTFWTHQLRYNFCFH